MTAAEFFIPGIPRPGGRKRAFVNKRTGRAMIVDACRKNPEWRQAVQWFARQAYDGQPLTEPLKVIMNFQLCRPKAHFRTNGQVKASAPDYPTTKPDVSKLIRSTEDALTGILWRDDAQIITQIGHKRYDIKPGCWISVQTCILEQPDGSDLSQL